MYNCVPKGAAMMNRRNVVFVYLAICLGLCVVPTRGQQESASITGRITDQSGSVIPGAKVTIQNQASDATFSSLSDSEGFYHAPQLRPAMYRISASAAGFS